MILGAAGKQAAYKTAPSHRPMISNFISTETEDWGVAGGGCTVACFKLEAGGGGRTVEKFETERVEAEEISGALGTVTS